MSGKFLEDLICSAKVDENKEYGFEKYSQVLDPYLKTCFILNLYNGITIYKEII